MGRQVARLSALEVSRKKVPGMYPDGGGLYLQVSPAGTKSWIFRFKKDGRARDMGLGSLQAVNLAQARKMATDARNLRQQGIDPIEARITQRALAKLEAAKQVTFRQATEAFIGAHKAAWKNPKQAPQWESSLKEYAYPIIGSLPVQAIDVAFVHKVLQPIWTTKPETASRVRGRIERILDREKTLGNRTGENPARWRGHLENLLPKRSQVRAVEHLPAMPYGKLGGFMAKLREEGSTSALALEFLSLTVTRTGEVIGARWSEFDLVERVWTIPADRMKAKREHRVPLVSRSFEIIRELHRRREDEEDGHVFGGRKKGRPLSNMAMLALLARMKHDDVTVHGFKSSFRDWAAERTSFPREVAEQALAHAIGDKVEAAYRRGDLFNKRQQLMDEWSKFCAAVEKPRGKVVPMRSSARAKR